MKKTRAYALLLAGIVLISLTGCGKIEQTAEKESDTPAPQIIRPTDVTSATETSDDITAEELSSPAAEPESSETEEQIPAQTAEEKTQETLPKENMATPPPAQSEKPIETQTPAQPEQTQTPVPTEPASEKPKTPVKQPSEEPKIPEFNVEYWITFAKNYAVSIGLELSPAATECWDNPINAGAHSSCLQRDIESRLNRYGRDEDITDVWVWAQERSDGSYDLYIGYA